MESIGIILKNAREEKGYSVEQAARETNIAKRYLEAIEAEDVSIFPGETYFIGFLRNYADFLGQDSEKLIGLYRNMKIQEQPPPMEELLDTKKKSGLPIIITVAVVLVLGAVFWLFILPLLDRGDNPRPVGEVTAAKEENTDEDRSSAAAVGDGTFYEFRDEILERKFLTGDTIGIYLGDVEYILIVEKAGEEIAVNFNGTSLELTLDVSALLDLSGNGENDLKILPRQVLPDEGAVVLYLDKYVESSDPVTRAPDSLDGEETGSGGSGTAAAEIADAEARGSSAVIGNAGDASREIREMVIMEEDAPGAYDLDVVFRGLCLMRYVADNNEREERYFHKSEVFRLEADREIRLWVSNAGSFKGKIEGNDIPLGNPGEVATRLIRWEKDNDSGKYQLKLIPVY